MAHALGRLVRTRSPYALATGLVLLLLAGCGKSAESKITPPKPSQSASMLGKASRVFVKVGKVVGRLLPFVRFAELVIEIKSVIDGKEETIVSNITQEQADSLKAGGRLVIEDATGTKHEVEYESK